VRHPHCASVKYTYSHHHHIQHNLQIFRLLFNEASSDLFIIKSHKNSRQTNLIVHTHRHQSVNVYIALTRHRRRNTEQVSFQSYKNELQYPSATNRKRMNTIQKNSWNIL